MSRLSIEIDADQHRQIKTLATFAGLSIKEYILQKTLQAKTTEVGTTEYLLSTPANAQRLLGASNTLRSEHLIFETVEDVKRALGI